MTMLAPRRDWSFQARLEMQFYRGPSEYTDAEAMSRSFAGFLRESTNGTVTLSDVQNNPRFNTIRATLLGVDGEHVRGSFTLRSDVPIDSSKIALAFAKTFQTAGHSGMSATRIASKTPVNGGCDAVDTAATASWNPLSSIFTAVRGTVINQVCLTWTPATGDNPEPETTLHDRSASSLGDAAVGSSNKPSEVGITPPGYGAGVHGFGINLWDSIPLEAKIGGGIIVVVALMVGVGYAIRSVNGAVG